MPTSYPGREDHHDLGNGHSFTLAPSLACRSCPSHGFIRDGHWVEA